MPGRRGRPPNPVTPEEAMGQVDAYLDSHLPKYIRKLGELAEKGDRQALTYLIDRRLGKPVERREESGTNIVKALEDLAKRINRKRRPSAELPEGDRRSLPDGRSETGTVDAVWTEVESVPANALPEAGLGGE